jgi:hypothetical protein
MTTTSDASTATNAGCKGAERGGCGGVSQCGCSQPSRVRRHTEAPSGVRGGCGREPPLASAAVPTRSVASSKHRLSCGGRRRTAIRVIVCLRLAPSARFRVALRLWFAHRTSVPAPNAIDAPGAIAGRLYAVSHEFRHLRCFCATLRGVAVLLKANYGWRSPNPIFVAFRSPRGRPTRSQSPPRRSRSRGRCSPSCHVCRDSLCG